MRRRKHEEDNENHDRWLVSYADFITLLFAFFVVMYAISSVNQGKYRQLTSSLGSAFGSVNSNPSTKNETQVSNSNANGNHLKQKPGFIEPLAIAKLKNEKMRIEREKLNAMATDLKTALQPMINDGKIQVMQTSRGIRIDIHDSLLFSPGSAQLNDIEALTTLQDIVPTLLASQQEVQIEGHTDNVPIKNALYPSNWELSAIRATTVLGVFSRGGVTESRLSAIGYGSSRPVAENETAEGRAKNRRVSIMILRDNLAPPIDLAQPAATQEKNQSPSSVNPG